MSTITTARHLHGGHPLFWLGPVSGSAQTRHWLESLVRERQMEGVVTAVDTDFDTLVVSCNGADAAAEIATASEIILAAQQDGVPVMAKITTFKAGGKYNTDHMLTLPEAAPRPESIGPGLSLSLDQVHQALVEQGLIPVGGFALLPECDPIGFPHLFRD